MNNVYDKLNEILDIETVPSTNTEVVPVESNSVVTVVANDVEDDYRTARETYKRLMEKGEQALDGLLEIAQQSEHPRAYEVASTLIRTLAETSKDLMQNHKTKKDIYTTPNASNQRQREQAEVGQINVDKAVFVGTPNDLIKSIKANKDDGNTTG